MFRPWNLKQPRQITTREELNMGRKSLASIRREEIIEAFLRVLSEKGYENATVREIAQAAGCTHRMLIHYFDTKEALVVAAVEGFIDSYAPGLEQELSKHSSPSRKMQALFDRFMNPESFDIAQIRGWMQIWALSDNHPAILQAIKNWYARIKGIIAEIVREGIKGGEFRKVDPNMVAELILESSEGGAALAAMDRDDSLRWSVSKARMKMYLEYLRNSE
jgi:AcrR family transcriptional regulator